MNDHFTITITDDNGVKQFNLHHFVKQAIIYALGFIGALALISVATMLYLNYSVDEIQEKRDGIESAYLELQDKNEDLKTSMNDTRNSLLLKKQELNELSDSLSKIETLIGIAPLDRKSVV